MQEISEAPTPEDPAASIPARVEVYCRSASCRARIRLPSGNEGHIKCPTCGRRFWTSTVAQSPIKRGLRGFIKNQDAVGGAAILLVGLAFSWLVALWIVREEMQHTLWYAFFGSAVSWLLLKWALARPNLDHVLVGALKETRLFFIVLTSVFAGFLILQLWRYGSHDPVASSMTVLQLERAIKKIQDGYLVEFLRSSGWKSGLAAIGFLVLFIRLKSLRDAVRGIVKHGTKGARVFLYVLTAACAFTFGGALSDGNLSRIEPVLKSEQQLIEGAFARYAQEQLPRVTEEVAEELANGASSADLAINLPPSDDSSSAFIDLLNPDGPVEPSANPPKPPPNTPLGSGPEVDGLRKSWEVALNNDLRNFRAVQDLAEEGKRIWGTEKAIELPKAPPQATHQQAVAARSTPASDATTSKTSAPEWRTEMHSLTRTGVGSALRGRLPSASELTANLGIGHPFKEQLKTVARQLADGPLEGAVKELVAEVLTESFLDLKSRTRDWVRKKFAGLSADSRLKQLQVALGKLRETAGGTFRELTPPASTPASNFEETLSALRRDHANAWKEAANKLPYPVERIARLKYADVEAKVMRLSPAAQAQELSRQMVAFEQNSVQGEFEAIERNYLGTREIGSAADAEILESQKAAARRAERLRLFSLRGANGGKGGKAPQQKLPMGPAEKVVKPPRESDPIGNCCCPRTGACRTVRRSECGRPC